MGYLTKGVRGAAQTFISWHAANTLNTFENEEILEASDNDG
jgi:ABC-type sulfate transport system substrate-binding protein